MTSLPGHLQLDGTLGAIQIETMLSCVLYGVTVMQTYVYFNHSDRDSTLYKIAIGLLWMLNTFHAAIFCHTAYTYTVTDYCDPGAMTKETWTVVSNTFITAAMNLGVRGLFSLRIWRLSGKHWTLAPMVIALSLGEFWASIVLGVKSITIIHGDFSKLHRFNAEFYTAVAFSIAADALIALTQVALLWNRRTIIPRTNSVIHILIMYSINTGLVTTIFALMVCITWAVLPNDLVWADFYGLVPTLLFSALLATLNARHELRETAAGGGAILPIPLAVMAPAGSQHKLDGRSRDSREASGQPIEVKIERMQHLV